MYTVEAELAFWRSASRAPSGCLLWAGVVKDNGYGRCGAALAGEEFAHRAAWVLVNGPIPGGQYPAHTCHDRATCRGGETCSHRLCIEPGHLELRPSRRSAAAGRGVAVVVADD